MYPGSTRERLSENVISDLNLEGSVGVNWLKVVMKNEKDILD